MSANFQNLMHDRIAYGNLGQCTPVNIYGRNAVVTTTHETIWDNSNLYTFLTTNMSSPTIVSSSANDAAAGTGARTVLISGVDATHTAQSETVTLNGASTVALVNNYMTINSIQVLTAGSGGVNAGTLTLAAGGVTHGFMQVGMNKTHSFIYHVPANRTLLLHNLNLQNANTTAGIGEWFVRTATNAGLVYISHIYGSLNTGGTPNPPFTVPLVFPEKTQLQVTAQFSAGTGLVFASANGYLINNTDRLVF